MSAKISFFLLLFLLPVYVALAQHPCSTYRCVIQKAEAALKAKKYDLTFENLESAAGYRDHDPEEIAALRKRLFELINGEKEQAILEREKAQQAERRSRELLKLAQAETHRADQQTLEAENEKRNAEAETRASRNALLALQTNKTNPTLALRLAEMNYHLHPASTSAIGLFREIYGDGRPAFFKKHIQHIQSELREHDWHRKL